MNASSSSRYARTIENSRRVRWEIERDVIRGRVSEMLQQLEQIAL